MNVCPSDTIQLRISWDGSTWSPSEIEYNFPKQKSAWRKIIDFFSMGEDIDKIVRENREKRGISDE